MIQIRPWLYVGRELEAYDKSLLKKNQIGAMLHLNEPADIPGIESCHLHVMERAGVEQKELREALHYISKNKQDGMNLLITSDAGVSRSAAFAAAAVKQDENLPLISALKAVLMQHPEARPHPGL